MKLGKIFGEAIVGGQLHGGKADRRRSVAADDEFLPASFLVEGEGDLKQHLPWRLLPWRLLVIFFFLLFTARLFSLQVIEGSKYLALSEDNRLHYETLPAARGVILDRRGEVIVRNAPAFKVVWLDYLGEATASGEQIAALLGVGREEVTSKIKMGQAEGGGEVVLRRNLTRDQAVKVEKVISRENLPLMVEVDSRRDYVYGETLAHAIGYLGEVSRDELAGKSRGDYRLGDVIGKDGLEKTYESDLRGKSGRRLWETTARGTVAREVRREEPAAGNDLVTTLDLSLSRVAAKILQEAVAKTNASGGVVVAQDPRSGEILIFLSSPSFSPNIFSAELTVANYQKLTAGPRQPLFDRVVGGAYPPGSVFKLVTGAAALQEGVVDEKTTVDDRGFISVGNFVYRDWKEGGHGLISFEQAIAQSCDTYFYTIGGGYGSQRGVGAEKIAAWARRFRLGSSLGVDLPGEAEGLVGDPLWKKTVRGEDWYIGNTYHMSIGQGDILTTPLQINSLTAAIANGGTLFRPHLLKKIRTANGVLVRQMEPEILAKNLLAEKTVKLIKEGMAGVNEVGGTAYPMQGFALKSGGKTGTAEFGSPTGKTHAWYTVFAPYDNPEIALTVLLEGGGEGSRDAAPVARQILEEWLKTRE